MTPLLQIRNLSYRHPDGTKALHDISFEMADGENLVVLGPNGSGKTTLLLHINGTLSDTGSVHLNGLEVNKPNLAEIRKHVGLVFQDADEQLFMPTVLEDVMFGPLNLGWSHDKAASAAADVLAQVGITPELFARPPFHLSAGEKRRVAIAGVLVMQPRILLLDEPTTSLDPPGQRALLDLLRTLPQSKLIATHDVNFAAGLSARALFLRSGQLAADGELNKIVRRYQWSLHP
jgi:cobalt/nickel transport system ATP-binding protein